MPQRALWPSALAAKAAGVGAVDYRIAPTPGSVAIQGARWIYTYVPPGSKGYEWNLIAELDNDSDEGNNAPAYFKARKYAKGPTWALCVEVQDFYPGTDGGPCFGAEIDYMGTRGRITTGAGVLCVVGRSSESPLRDPADKGVAHLDAFFRLVPYFYDAGFVKLNYLIRSEIKCEVAILSMQGGDCIKFSDDPAVPVHRFDPQTGFIGYFTGPKCIWGVHAVTGQVVQNWTPPGAK